MSCLNAYKGHQPSDYVPLSPGSSSCFMLNSICQKDADKGSGSEGNEGGEGGAAAAAGSAFLGPCLSPALCGVQQAGVRRSTFPSPHCSSQKLYPCCEESP